MKYRTSRQGEIIICLVLTVIIPFAGCSSSSETASGPELSEEPVVKTVEIFLLDKHVSAKIPRRWELIQKTPLKELYLIPFPEADNTPHSANAAIVTDKCDALLTVKEFGDLTLSRMIDPSKPNIIVSDNQDGKYWRSVLWRGQDQVPYIIWDRFGVKNEICVHLRIGWPLLDNSSESAKIIMEEINAVTESLTIR